MKLKEFLKKYSAFIAVGVVSAVFITSVAFSIVAFKTSLRIASQVETLSQDYFRYSKKVDLTLDSIEEKVDFMKDFVINSAGGVQLGDTYINHPTATGKNSTVKSK